jgi:hypothetical protein
MKRKGYEVNDEDRRKLDQLIHLLQGFKLETRGIRQHVSTVADLTEQTIKECLRVLQAIRDNKPVRGQTWPGDSK